VGNSSRPPAFGSSVALRCCAGSCVVCAFGAGVRSPLPGQRAPLTLVGEVEQRFVELGAAVAEEAEAGSEARGGAEVQLG
jgi:hypothetical protein